MLCGLVDTMLAKRKLFVLHQRNQTALSSLHIKGHDGDHEELELTAGPGYGRRRRNAPRPAQLTSGISWHRRYRRNA